MNSKIVVILIIGLVAGGGLGYFISFNTFTPQIYELEARLIDTNRELEQEHTRATTQLEDTHSKFEDLESDYFALEVQFSNLQADYDDLKVQNTNLQSDYDDLLGYNEEISERYDQLLSTYERTLGAIPLQPEPISTEVIEKEYDWWFDGRKWTLSINIPESIYDYYAELQRPPTEDYSVYVTHPFDDEYMRTLIEKINFIAYSRDYSESEKVNLVITFVQSLPYTSDSVTTPYDEYPRYPLETLVDGGGDCEDTSILVASLLHGMNYDVILLGLPGHMACGVYTEEGYGSYWLLNSREYFYLETTSEGWEIGDVPQEYEGESAYLYELTAIPILSHDWTAAWIGNDLELSVTVSNMGTAIAQDIVVYVALDAGEDYVWNPIETESFDLEFGREVTVDVIIEVPKNEHTRLIVGVLDSDGYLVDESYSEWFDT